MIIMCENPECGQTLDVSEYMCPKCGNTAKVVPDMLADLYNRCVSFTESAVEKNPRELDISLDEGSPKEHENLMVRNTVAMMVELGEFAQRIPFKWWGRGVWEISEEDKEKIAMELVDLNHFVFVAYQLLDLSAGDVYRLFDKKLKENEKRLKEEIGWKKANK